VKRKASFFQMVLCFSLKRKGQPHPPPTVVPLPLPGEGLRSAASFVLSLSERRQVKRKASFFQMVLCFSLKRNGQPHPPPSVVPLPLPGEGLRSAASFALSLSERRQVECKTSFFQMVLCFSLKRNGQPHPPPSVVPLPLPGEGLRSATSFVLSLSERGRMKRKASAFQKSLSCSP